VSLVLWSAASLTPGGEYGGIEPDYKNWSGNARLTVPFRARQPQGLKKNARNAAGRPEGAARSPKFTPVKSDLSTCLRAPRWRR
jgi:hypothetical protein